MNNMIESCGAEWCNRRVAGGYFLHEGNVLRADTFSRRTVQCTNVAKDEFVELDPKVFTGFRVFMYPRLGYRRHPKSGVVVFMRRINSYDRGLRPRRVSCVVTAANLAMGRDPAIPDAERMDMVFRPQYDDITAVRDVIAGERISAILNEDILVEPSMNADQREYTVYYRTVRAATISPDKAVTWRSAAYEQLLSIHFKDL